MSRQNIVKWCNIIGDGYFKRDLFLMVNIANLALENTLVAYENCIRRLTVKPRGIIFYLYPKHSHNICEKCPCMFSLGVSSFDMQIQFLGGQLSILWPESMLKQLPTHQLLRIHHFVLNKSNLNISVCFLLAGEWQDYVQTMSK